MYHSFIHPNVVNDTRLLLLTLSFIIHVKKMLSTPSLLQHKMIPQMKFHSNAKDTSKEISFTCRYIIMVYEHHNEYQTY